jgi:uncharacterized membrane protein YhaH (DUF805 family)
MAFPFSSFLIMDFFSTVLRRTWSNNKLGGKFCFVLCLDVHLEEEEMHLLDQRILGIAILFLLGMLVIVKRVATGSILDKPKGNLMVQLVNIFNLFFLLVVNPLAAISLITRRLATIDATHMAIDEPWILMVLEVVGLVMYVIGYLLMAWALITLGRNYQLGGSAPRPEDKIVMDGTLQTGQASHVHSGVEYFLGAGLPAPVLGFLLCVLHLSCVDSPADSHRGRRIAENI